ncbi:MAG: hypothetical protein M1828_007299 [Chrysothrix sp. TS-e1954]|nr:MAG: hypothetical protein M1828_007299 [Chrysothrix sp. TS-e1954]
MSAPSTRHTDLLETLQKDASISVHPTTVISSTKINYKVTQVLSLLSNTPPSTSSSSGNHLVKADASLDAQQLAIDPMPTDTEEHPITATDAGTTKHLSAPKASIVAITAKASVANKLISIIEIVKRTVSTSPTTFLPGLDTARTPTTSDTVPNTAALAGPESDRENAGKRKRDGDEEVEDWSGRLKKARVADDRDGEVQSGRRKGDEGKQSENRVGSKPTTQKTGPNGKDEVKKRPVLYQYTTLTSTPATPKGPAPRKREGPPTTIPPAPNRGESLPDDPPATDTNEMREPIKKVVQLEPDALNQVAETSVEPPPIQSLPNANVDDMRENIANAPQEPTDEGEQEDDPPAFSTQNRIALPTTTDPLLPPKPRPPVPLLTIYLSTVPVEMLREKAGEQVIYSSLPA